MKKYYKKPKIFTGDPDQMADKRTCGQCTACCTCPSLAVPGCKQLSAHCVHLRRGRAKAKRPGCAIYNARPSNCQDYACFWRLGMLGRHERPDKLGIIFDTAEPTAREVIAAAGVPVVYARETYPGSSDNPLTKIAILAMADSFGVIRVGIAPGPIVHSATQEITDKVIDAILAVAKGTT